MADDPRSPANSAPIGYRQPPPGFRKGQSGNPAGRPKGSRNTRRTQGERLRSLMLKEAYRPIKVEANGREITVPVAQAVLRSLAEAAAKGEARAQATFLKMVSASELEESAALEEARKEEAGEEAEDEPPQFEIVLVDPVDGSRAPYRPGGNPDPQTGKGK